MPELTREQHAAMAEAANAARRYLTTIGSDGRYTDLRLRP